MAGIYIHIPFCKQACFYCDFHFSVNHTGKEKMVSSICKELSQRSDYLNGEMVESIYFGGGTPSLLGSEELEKVVSQVHRSFRVSEEIELTLEANPDDLDEERCKELFTLGVNRLSIGIQSFNDDILKWMNRAHTASEAKKCAFLAADAGFEDLSIDLIYGVPGLSNELWEETLDEALHLPVNHLSAYSLTLEKETPYQKLVNQKKYAAPREANSIRHFNQLSEMINEKNWERYEISNYCKDEKYAKHNTAYWQHKPYLGVGPSAHSFNGSERRWNVRDNKRYVESIEKGILEYESEQLTQIDKVNETILTGLRTKWGVDKGVVSQQFRFKIQELIEKRWMYEDGKRLKLTEEGLAFADGIASDLFQV